MITGIAHACFTVSDLERSIAFYRDGLGLTPAFDFVNDEGRRFGVYLHAGGRNFIELFEGELGERGVEVSDPKLGKDQSWQAWIADPDGNRFELHQYTAESWQAPALGDG